MRERLWTLIAACATATAAVWMTPVHINGHAARPAPKAAAATLTRTADGHPDLQGTYDLGTLTPMERRPGQPLVLTDEEAKTLEAQVAQRNQRADAPIAADRAAPPKGGDGTPGPYGNVGGYNNFWLDPGSQFTSIDGRKRSSLIIDPPDGRVPPLTEAARQRRSSGDYNSRPTSDAAAREDDPGFEGPDAYNDPEIRPLAERCLLGFSSTSGPPILPTYKEKEAEDAAKKSKQPAG